MAPSLSKCLGLLCARRAAATATPLTPDAYTDLLGRATHWLSGNPLDDDPSLDPLSPDSEVPVFEFDCAPSSGSESLSIGSIWPLGDALNGSFCVVVEDNLPMARVETCVQADNGRWLMVTGFVFAGHVRPLRAAGCGSGSGPGSGPAQGQPRLFRVASDQAVQISGPGGSDLRLGSPLESDLAASRQRAVVLGGAAEDGRYLYEGLFVTRDGEVARGFVGAEHLQEEEQEEEVAAVQRPGKRGQGFLARAEHTETTTTSGSSIRSTSSTSSAKKTTRSTSSSTRSDKTTRSTVEIREKEDTSSTKKTTRSTVEIREEKFKEERSLKEVSTVRKGGSGPAEWVAATVVVLLLVIVGAALGLVLRAVCDSINIQTALRYIAGTHSIDSNRPKIWTYQAVLSALFGAMAKTGARLATAQESWGPARDCRRRSLGGPSVVVGQGDRFGTRSPDGGTHMAFECLR